MIVGYLYKQQVTERVQGMMQKRCYLCQLCQIRPELYTKVYRKDENS